MNPIHVTSLTSFIQCPFKFKNDEYSPDIAETYPGDMLNIAVNSNGPTDAYFTWYMANFSVDFKQIHMMKKAHAEARKYVENLKKDNYVYQEAKHYLKWMDEMIVGSTDLVIIPRDFDRNNPKEDVFISVEDLKFSTHAYYIDGNLFDYDAQSFVYPLMLMDYYKVDKIEFSFVCWDKAKGSMKKATIIRCRSECQEYVDRTMTKYLECNMLGEYPRHNNKFCEGCQFKIWCEGRFAKR